MARLIVNLESTSFITCVKKNYSSENSLVDKGANVGVAGNDIRVIVKHPYRTF